MSVWCFLLFFVVFWQEIECGFQLVLDLFPQLESVSQRDSIQDGEYSFSARSYQSWGFGDVS